MSNRTENTSSRRRSRATRILAWILSILMMGSAAAVLIELLLHAH